MPSAPTRPVDLYPTRGPKEELIGRKDPVVWSGPGTAGPFWARELEEFERDGFATVDEIVTPDEVDVLRAELDRLVSDPAVRADERAVVEPRSQEIRSVFEVHRMSEVFGRLARDPRIVGRARQILGSDVYVPQSRVNVQPSVGATGV
ncbi:phytanoyl-CoA dioxygenase family protein, partial [Streptomyces sp. NPDC059556]|uniref:phytanoyl-CoA dioxygenase family protein n=1 Tax=Streptomyces sp. NPDC059556 TaxID=3346863 RepID=UPI0036C2C2CA